MCCRTACSLPASAVAESLVQALGLKLTAIIVLYALLPLVHPSQPGSPLLFLFLNNNLESSGHIGVQFDCGLICAQLLDVWQLNQFLVELSAGLCFNGIHYFLLSHTAQETSQTSHIYTDFVIMCIQGCTSQNDVGLQ